MLPDEDQATTVGNMHRKFGAIHVWFLKYVYRIRNAPRNTND